MAEAFLFVELPADQFVNRLHRPAGIYTTDVAKDSKRPVIVKGPDGIPNLFING